MINLLSGKQRRRMSSKNQEELALDQLILIFSETPIHELERILSRNSYQVEAAIEAILMMQEETETTTTSATSFSPTRVHLPPAAATAAATSFSSSSAAAAAVIHTENEPQPTIVALPPTSPNDNRTSSSSSSEAAAEQRRLALQMAQKKAREKEQQDLYQALADSLTPSHRGLDYLSDEELSQLLLDDPVFLASLDAADLQEVAQLQTKLDVAEAEWKSLAASDAGGNKTAKNVNSNNKKHEARQRLSSQLRRLAAKRTSKFQSRLDNSFLIRARSSLGIATDKEERLVEELEAMNRENEEEQIRRKIRLEAKTAMLAAVGDHLTSFLLENPTASYEQWIEELHPENAHDGLLLEEFKTIDHRFYVEESEHRQMWNERCRSDPTRQRSVVSTRRGDNNRQGNCSTTTRVAVVDLLSDEI